MPDLSDATSGRLVGVALTAVALVLFGLLSVAPLTGTGRTIAFLVLLVMVSIGAIVALGAWLIRRQSEPLSDRPEELNEDW